MEMPTITQSLSSSPRSNNNDIEHGKSGDTADTAIIVNPNLPPEPVIGQGFLKPVPETTPIERATGIVAIIAVTMALLAIIIQGSIIVIIAGILSIILSPYSYYQQTRLTDIRTLQETKNTIANEVNKLENENKRLVLNIDSMTSSIDKLNEIDQALTILTNQQGTTIDTFQIHVEENKRILNSMKGNLKANILQNLLSILLRSDMDNDSIIDNNEINHLIERIQNISGVTVHEDRFRSATSGRSIKDVMEVVKNLLNSEVVPVDERIFEFQNNYTNSSNPSSPNNINHGEEIEVMKSSFR